MIIRYYNSALTFESAENVDYYTDYETLKAGNGAKFISYPNQRFARALRQTRLTYIHGIGSAGVLENEDFSDGGLSFFTPWVFTQQTTSDTAQQIFNPSGGSGQYYTLINLNNTADDTIPGDLSRLTQVGNLVSAAGGATQLQLTVRVRFTPIDPIPVTPDPYPERYWYLRVGSNYYNESTNAWQGSLVWNTFDTADLFVPLNFSFVTYTYTTPILPASGIAEVAVTGTTGDQNFANGVAYDLVEIQLIIDGEIEDSNATRYQANVDTRSSLVQELGPVLINDGPTSGNVSRLTRDVAGDTDTFSWGGEPLQDVLTRRWLGVLRANRRLVEGSTIGIDTTGRINRGLYWNERFYVPIYAEWLAKSRTWAVRLHEFATDETGITFSVSQEDDQRNRSGDIYEEPAIS